VTEPKSKRMRVMHHPPTFLTSSNTESFQKCTI
jgi:hypothetical protein